MLNDAKASLWAHAVLSPWYLREDQLPIYELLLRDKNPFIECARRYGKTTSILCFVIESLLRNPGWICTWCEPDKNQAREIVQPEIAKIFQGAPKEMRPVWHSTDSYYWFPSTGTKEFASKLKLRGVNHDRGDSARGPFANIIVADEFGTWKDPDYIVTSALRPQLQTTNGPFIFASTPPEDLGHPYYDHKAWAIAEGRFIQRVIYDNGSLTPERLEELKRECRGEHTPAWRREYLCEPVSDPERLVIPEYDPGRHDVPDDYERPAAFDGYVGIDLGLSDATAGLFAYVDFLKRELVIDSEWVANGKNTEQIVKAFRAQEKLSFGTDECRCELMAPVTGPKLCMRHGLQPWMRVGDNEAQQLWDMQSLHGYTVSPTRKDDKLAALNALRLLFTEGRIKIKQRCESLRYQLKVGLWNDRRTDFQRGEKTGHLDAIDALIYLARNINWTRNPYPQNVGVSQYTHFAPDLPVGPAKDAESALEAAFGSLMGTG